MDQRRFTFSDETFDKLNIACVSIITLLIIYPLIFVVSASISDPHAVDLGRMWLWPVDITFDGYRRVFQNEAIWIGYKNTLIYTSVGTAIHLFILLPGAYALSRSELVGQKILLWFVLFTMLFEGGIIPLYIVVRKLGMLDTM